MTCKNCKCDECSNQNNIFENEHYRFECGYKGESLFIYTKNSEGEMCLFRKTINRKSLPLLEKAIARAKELRGE